MLGRRRLHRRLACVGVEDLVVAGGEVEPERPPDLALVLDDQDLLHDASGVLAGSASLVSSASSIVSANAITARRSSVNGPSPSRGVNTSQRPSGWRRSRSNAAPYPGSTRSASSNW